MPSPSAEPLPWASLRARLTLWNTLVVLLTVTAALLAVRLGARAMLFREADAVLVGEVNEVVLALREFSPDTAAVVDELRRKAEGHEARGWFTQLLDRQGRTIWKSETCPMEVVGWPVDAGREKNLVQVEGYRFARSRIADRSAEHFDVRIGMPTAYLDEDIDALTRLLIPVGLGIAIITPAAGYWLALRATRPIADILETADQLRPTRLGDRLTVRGAGDELDHLSNTINRLLDQVAGHVERQQQFVADAAHELRGPLAAIRTTLEVATLRAAPGEDHQGMLEAVLEQTRQLSKLTNDLLLLAETTSDSADPVVTPVDLAAVARQTVAMFSGVAEDRGLQMNAILSPPEPANVIIRGEVGQLRQLVGNLIDNAVRFTPVGGQITVEVAITRDKADGPQALLRVCDTGVGIAPTHLERIFDRFYQVDEARPRDQGRGGGLGLAICQSIVTRHGGSLSVASTPGQGTAFTARFPTALPNP
jgi:two-component system heavy metal sensor histidine kinase CusS